MELCGRQRVKRGVGKNNYGRADSIGAPSGNWGLIFTPCLFLLISVDCRDSVLIQSPTGLSQRICLEHTLLDQHPLRIITSVGLQDFCEGWSVRVTLSLFHHTAPSAAELGGS